MALAGNLSVGLILFPSLRPIPGKLERPDVEMVAVVTSGSVPSPLDKESVSIPGLVVIPLQLARFKWQGIRCSSGIAWGLGTAGQRAPRSF
jgi:hypothetical protein